MNREINVKIQRYCRAKNATCIIEKPLHYRTDDYKPKHAKAQAPIAPKRSYIAKPTVRDAKNDKKIGLVPMLIKTGSLKGGSAKHAK